MRRAVHIDSRKRAPIESVRDFRQSAVQCQLMCDLDGRLGFKTVGAARTLELERAVVGDVDLLVRAIDPEQVGAG